MSFFKSSKYGIIYTTELNKTVNSVYTPYKWLLSRWYIHGASNIGLTTVLTKIKQNKLLINNKNILFVVNEFNLNELQQFNLYFKLRDIFFNKILNFIIR